MPARPRSTPITPQHERAAAIAAAQTLAHERETLNLLEHARSEEEETHHLRQQAHVLLVDTQAHERDAAQALAQIGHRLGQPATAAGPAEAAPPVRSRDRSVRPRRLHR